MKKFSLFLLIVLTMSICASGLDFRVYNKNATRSIVTEDVEAIVSKALKLDEIGDDYFRVGVNVYASQRGDGEDLVVYLYRKDSYTIDDYQVTVYKDGSYNVTRDYVEPTLDDENEPCGTCPDETVEVVVSTPILDPNFYLAEKNVKEAEKILNEAGIKTVKLLGEDATGIDIIKNWLSCPNLKMWGRIGHGLDRTGEIVVGNNAKLGPNYWKQNPGMLSKKIMLWNSCYVHSEPCKSALLSDADAFWFAAGDGVVLQAGPNKSEPVWLRWIEKAVLGGEELSKAMDDASSDFSYFDYGRTGNPNEGSQLYWNDIYGNYITVESPNGSEELIVGTDVEITWSTNSDNPVDVELLKNGSKVETIKSGVASSKTSVTWTLSEDLEPGDDYTIQLVTGDTSDVSDDEFTIKLKPSITISLDEIEIAVDTGDNSVLTEVLSINNTGKGNLKYSLKCKGGNNVLINEIFTPHSEFFDGFELWNRGEDLDMTGWTVVWNDNNSTSGSYDFEDGFIFKSGKTVVFTDDQNATNSSTFYVGVNLGWSITEGTELSITVYDADGNGVDFVKSSGNSDTPPAYGCDWTGDGIKLDQQRLYRNTNDDNDNASDWVGGSGESSVNQINDGQSMDGVGAAWLKFSIKEGVVNPDKKADITLTFDGTGMKLGEYLDTITLTHDDPDKETNIVIPVKMTVDPKVSSLAKINSVKSFGLAHSAQKVMFQVPTFASDEKVSINIYSLNGRLTKVLVNEVMKPGTHSVALGNDLATGSYICKMETKSFRKAMLIVNNK